MKIKHKKLFWLSSIFSLIILCFSFQSLFPATLSNISEFISGGGIRLQKYRQQLTIGIDDDYLLSHYVIANDYTQTFKSLDLITKGPWVDARAYDTLELANTAAYNFGKALLIAQNYTLTSNTTLTASVIRIAGGSFTKASTYTLTFSGRFVNPDNGQAFIGFNAGDVTFGAGAVKEVYPEWFGNNTTPGTTDMTVEIQSAISSISEGKVSFLNTDYLTSDNITIPNHRITLEGVGPKATHINFVPIANNKYCFIFQKSTAVQIVQNCIKNLSIGSTDTTYQKTGIKLVDVSEFRLQNVAINPMNDVAYTSVGIEVAGRDVSSFIDPEISADIPIYVTKNPNTATSDMTGFNFHNMYTIATSTNPHIKISSNCWVVALSITGQNTWALGKYGIYMADTETTSAMYNWVIDGLIWEQVSEVGGYFAYIAANTQITNLTFRNCYLGGGGMNANGWYFRKANFVTLDNCYYVGTGTPYNLDDTVYPFELRNFYSGGGTPVTGNLRPVHYITSATGVVNYALYTDPATTNGSFYLQKIGTFADSATPSVSNGNIFLTGGTTTITNFTGGWVGQEIKIISEHAITITDGTNIFLNGSANYVMGATDTLTLIQKADTKWYELSRSNN